MPEAHNSDRIIRKDEKHCFVERLYDAFGQAKAHLVFAAYDLNRPAGHRQTNCVHIYISMSKMLELCRKFQSGEMRWMVDQKRKSGDNTPIQEWIGGTSAEKLCKFGRERPDGKSLSRTCKLVCGSKTEFLLVADSGPGEQTEKGLIVPRFGTKPENHVAVSMTWESMSELILMTKTHYESWLTA